MVGSIHSQSADVATRCSAAADSHGALGFLSRSLLEVQRSAEDDWRTMSARAASLKDLAQRVEDWEKALGRNPKVLSSIRLPEWGPREEASAGGLLLQRLRDTSKALAGLEEIQVIRALKEKGLPAWQLQLQQQEFLQLLQQQQLQPKQQRKRHLQPGKQQSQQQQEQNQQQQGKQKRPGGSFGKSVRSRQAEAARREKPWLLLESEQFAGRALVRLDEWQAAQATKQPWQPLQKVKEGLKELESKAASGGPASQFFHKVSKSLKLDDKRSPLEAEAVPPLDVPELLESLVRQSEPILDHFGVDREVSTKVRSLIRSCKRSLSFSSLSTMAATASADSATYALREAPEEELDFRIARVQESTGYKHRERPGGDLNGGMGPGKKRNIAIFTTASLPWMTGTAVNPLLRAAYLAQSGEQNVTLLVPWLSKYDQEKVYPNQITFDSPAEQEQYVRNWLHSRIGFSADFKIAFYPGTFSVEKRSILAVGDISAVVAERDADVAVLEEPEHLTWYYHGRRWADKFRSVVGVVHTNYLEYVRRERGGRLQALLLEQLNNWLVRCYCHKVIRLSAATQELPRSIVCNVHGVGIKFLEIGSKMAEFQKAGKTPFSKGAYYLGKMVWSKGYRELVDLLAENKSVLGSLKVDVYGSGEDAGAVQEVAKERGLKMKFHKGRDHADVSIQHYKVFINPSLSDVVCTTTAEALAMGKIVVCADHPSNEFFRGFPNCLTYKSREEFVARVQQALAMEPEPLSDEHRHLLSWEAATERFLDCAGLDRPQDQSAAAEVMPITRNGRQYWFEGKRSSPLKKTLSLSMSMPDMSSAVDRGLFYAHYMLSGVELVRRISGAPRDSMHVSATMAKEMGLPPPHVERPVYGW